MPVGETYSMSLSSHFIRSEMEDRRGPLTLKASRAFLDLKCPVHLYIANQIFDFTRFVVYVLCEFVRQCVTVE